MSLATRCPHCNTIFKVVQDQLKVSEGWVRCGRCQEVFNALEGLFDMEREPPPQRVAPTAMAAPDELPSASPHVDPYASVTDTDAAPQTPESSVVTPAPIWSPPAPFPDQGDGSPDSWPSPPDDILPQEELQAPMVAVSAPPMPRSPLVGDAIQFMDAPQGAVTHFELELPPSAEALAAAVSNVMQPPYEAAQVMPADSQALPPLPVTDEADALDSRYLLSSDMRPERRPNRRRPRGPEFADAQFPTDAMADAIDWGEAWPDPDDADGEAGDAAADMLLAESGTSPQPAGLVSQDRDVYRVDAHEPVGLPSDEPPAGAQLLSRLEPSAFGEEALARQATTPVDAGPTTLPSRFNEDYQPEQSLPPPSKRKGRPGTRGRSPQAGDEPEFIKQAERKAIWRHPAIRAVLAVLAVGLTLGLAGQVAHHERDLLASRYPALSPWLQRWCELARCTVGAPMQLDDLQVDNIALVRTSSQGDDTYRLTAIIRNRADMPLAWPHLDLSLTDANGEVVVRRVFAVTSAVVKSTPAGSTGTGDEPTTGVPPEVPASSSTTLQWQLRAPDLQLAGYTAELFYP